MNPSRRLPAVDTYEFKQLTFREQLYIFSLFLEDKDRYKALTGGNTGPLEGLEYLERDVRLLLDVKGVPSRQSSMPIEFIENQWACYNGRFSSSWFDPIISPLDVHGLRHKRVLGVDAFDFPMVVLDRCASEIASWLIAQNRQSIADDMLYYIAWMRAAAKDSYDSTRFLSLSEGDRSALFSSIWNEAACRIGPATTIDELNDYFPTIENSASDLYYQVEDGTYVVYYKCLSYLDDARSFIPLVPEELVSDLRFSLSSWSFIEVGANIP